MDGYNVLIKPSAVKELEDIPRRDRERVVRRIHGLAGDPRPPGCEKLSAEEKYRVRQGTYRVIYAIGDEARTILVVKIAHRREAYR